MRTGRVSIRLLALMLTAGLLAGCGPGAATPTPTATPTATVAPTATVTASPTASPGDTSGAIIGDTGDSDDEPAASETPAIGFSPGPSGIPAPTPPASMARLPGEPDPALTPGALNPAVTQATIGSTICVSGWTDTIRPPTSYTNTLKATQITQYSYTDTSPASYEEDHLISLQLGGNPTDPKNLWPEPYTISLSDGRSVGARVKDVFETKLKKQVCAGTMTLAQAQTEIGIHWVHFDFSIP
ncbi:MAG: hypothetical protein ABSE70_05380 [Candidatus Limnocylindrales bacterium]